MSRLFSRRNLIRLGLYTCGSIVFYNIGGKDLIRQIAARTGRHRGLENLLAKNFGPFANEEITAPFIAYIAKEHSLLLRDDYLEQDTIRRHVTAMFILNSNMPETQFNMKEYEFEIRPEICNPFANLS